MTATGPPIESTAAGVRFLVHVSPRASKDSVRGFHAAGRLIVRVTAPPVDGEANAAVVELLARQLRVSRSEVRVTRGASSRTKLIEIDGLDAATAAERLAPIPETKRTTRKDSR
ncbi:MAG TPA: DUF167 domain-containing protein [Candidatus Eisenbacteria bacterium]